MRPHRLINACAWACALAALAALAGHPPAALAAVDPPGAARTLDLAQAQALARAHSPRLKEGAAAAHAASARQDAAEARFFPKVGLQARYSRVSHVEPGSIALPLTQPNGQPLPAMQLGEAIDDQTSIRLTLEQPLFTGFGLSRGLDAARLGGAVVEASRAVDDADLRLRVEEAYFGLLRAQRGVGVARGTLRAHEARAEDVGRLVAAERATGLEATRMWAQVAAARAGVARAEAGREVAEAALASLLGWPEGDAIALSEGAAEPDPAPDARGGGPDGLDVVVARRTADLRGTQARAAEAALWPQLALRLGATVANPNERYFPPSAEWNATWDVSLVLNWQFDALATAHEARAAEAEATRAALAADGLADRTRLEARRQAAVGAGAAAAVVALREAVAASERAVVDTEALFRAGRVSLTELLDRQNELERVQLDLLDAEIEARLAHARWRRWAAPAPAAAPEMTPVTQE